MGSQFEGKAKGKGGEVRVRRAIGKGYSLSKGNVVFTKEFIHSIGISVDVELHLAFFYDLDIEPNRR